MSYGPEAGQGAFRFWKFKRGVRDEGEDSDGRAVTPLTARLADG
ncbi:hypothetical protein ACXR0O_14995 [Verrucomicrobiota bacterium sgz303538]